MSVKCKHCDAELPDEAKFCLSCGRSVDMLVLEPVKPPSGSDTDTRAVILLAFGIFTVWTEDMCHPFAMRVLQTSLRRKKGDKG